MRKQTKPAKNHNQRRSKQKVPKLTMIRKAILWPGLAPQVEWHCTSTRLRWYNVFPWNRCSVLHTNGDKLLHVWYVRCLEFHRFPYSSLRHPILDTSRDCEQYSCSLASMNSRLWQFPIYHAENHRIFDILMQKKEHEST